MTNISRVSPTIIVLSMLLFLLLTSCAHMFIQQHGYIASDTESVRENREKAYIPGNAPSVSQGFKPQKGHEGIDIISRKGTPVMAAASGVVIRSLYRPLLGNRIVIDHGKDENGLYILSRYAHLDKRIVEEGDKVIGGQQIGTLGSTGLLAGGFPHLHFELRRGSRPDLSSSNPINPHLFWVNGVGIVTCFDANKKWPAKPFGTTYPVPCK